MDLEQFFERYKPFLKQNLLPLALGFLGLMFLGYGLITLLFSSSASNKLLPEPSIMPTTAVSKIVVDVEGAVAREFGKFTN